MAKKTKPKKAVKTAAEAPKGGKKSNKSFSARLIKRKPYIEFVTAFLSIPVLITVMLLNFNSLKNLTASPTPTPVPGGNQSGFYTAPVGSDNEEPNKGDNPLNPCTKGLGPVSIATPNENDTVTDNPVTINISYDDSVYCGASWSYRINGGSWSGYDDRSVALYNLPQGQVKFELRVKSIVTSEQKTLTRNFTYNGKNSVIIPSSPTSTGSAN